MPLQWNLGHIDRLASLRAATLSLVLSFPFILDDGPGVTNFFE